MMISSKNSYALFNRATIKIPGPVKSPVRDGSVVSFRHPAIRAFAGHRLVLLRCRPKMWSAPRAWPSNEMFALIGRKRAVHSA